MEVVVQDLPRLVRAAVNQNLETPLCGFEAVLVGAEKAAEAIAQSLPLTVSMYDGIQLKALRSCLWGSQVFDDAPYVELMNHVYRGYYDRVLSFRQSCDDKLGVLAHDATTMTAIWRCAVNGMFGAGAIDVSHFIWLPCGTPMRDASLASDSFSYYVFVLDQCSVAAFLGLSQTLSPIANSMAICLRFAYESYCLRLHKKPPKVCKMQNPGHPKSVCR